MEITRILLVHASHYDDEGRVVRADRLIDKLFVANVVHSALPLLAAYIPPGIDVDLMEDCFEPIPFEDAAEVVAISAQVMQIERALDLAGEFRRRGKLVLMGGYLPTMHPELVSPHVDALCIGDGDEVFPRMLEDIRKDRLAKIYKGSSRVDLDRIPTPRYELIKKDRTTIYPVHATRGCPFLCDYCSIIQFHEKTYRKRPIEHVIRDITEAKKHTRMGLIYFSDDNLMEDFGYAKRLFREMIPLRVKWGTQTTINIAKDPELLKLAYKAGCRWVALGIESTSQEALNKVHKGFNRVAKYDEQIAAIQSAGIAVHALIMFGLDDDKPDIFMQTLDYLDELKVACAEFFICTPYPATPLGRLMAEEGRLVDADLAHYREGYVVFKHPHLSAAEILYGYWWTLRSFYGLKRIVKRLLHAGHKDKLYHLTNSLYYWIKVKRDIIPVYFGKGNRRVRTSANDCEALGNGWPSKWFPILREYGEFTDIAFARIVGDRGPQWRYISHDHHDGAGAFCRILQENGEHPCEMLQQKMGKEPAFPGFLSGLLKYALDCRVNSMPWVHRDLEKRGVKQEPEAVIFCEEESVRLESLAIAENVSVNTLLLCVFDDIVRDALMKKSNRPNWWLIPVNMRSARLGMSGRGNCASYIVAKIWDGDQPGAVHERLMKSMKQGYHWASWRGGILLGRWIGVKGMKKVMEKYYNNNHSWTGTFSNLGEWNGRCGDDIWCFCPPATRAHPLAAGCVKYNRRYTLSMQIHPSLTEDRGIYVQLLNRWKTLALSGG